MSEKISAAEQNIPDPPPPGVLTYGAYLHVPELLDLQKCRSDPEEHDEMLFIVIHQVYELWFKLVMHELDKAHQNLVDGKLFMALATLKRIRVVLKTLVGQLDILETMTPLQFASFRSRLEMASGFQSAQFRAFEFAMGYKRPQMIKFYPEGTPERALLQDRLDKPCIVDGLYAFLKFRGVELPEDIANRDIKEAIEPNEAVQEVLIKAYREDTDLSLLLEALTDIDEGVQEWRYRHVKMVERTIGVKMGTGGSAGAEYLKRTLFKPFFPDLWAIRSRF
jgi:tryptophan 2,3-dioxygenase